MEQLTAVVDFGTSHTVTVVSGQDLPPRAVSVDGSPLIPSAVYWDRAGVAVLGHQAYQRAVHEPARLEPRPKSRMVDGEVLLGDSVVATTELVRAVLTKVLAAAAAEAGKPVQYLVLTHPADWGSARIGALITAAQGLAPRMSTVPEPIAAAAWYAGGHDFPLGAALGVLDFGGGTCDAAIVRREPAGFTVIGCAGLPDLGGDDLDQRIVDWLVEREPRLAPLVAAGSSVSADRSPIIRLREAVRAAKETLTYQPQAEIRLPAGLPDHLLTRAEFEGLVRADLTRAVDLLTGLASTCELRTESLIGVHLVGGSSRVPLLAQLLGAATSAPVLLDERPETVVVYGGHSLISAGGEQTAEIAPTPTPTVSSGQSIVDYRTPGRRRAPAIGAAVLVILLLVVTTIGLARGPETVPGVAAASVSGPAPVTLPPPVDGDELREPGMVTEVLPTVPLGQFAALTTFGSQKPMQWRLDEFIDNDEMSEQLADLNDEHDSRYRHVVIKTTMQAGDQPLDVFERGIVPDLVDDHGLLMGIAPDSRTPGDCSISEDPLAPGQSVVECLVYRIPATTPVTEVVLSPAGLDRWYSRRSPEELTNGARVSVAGKKVSGDAQPPPDAVAAGTPQEVVNDAAVASVAVVDLVTETSGYFPGSPVLLPGSRVVLVRMVVRPDRPVSANFVNRSRISVIDERGGVIGADALADAGDCTDPEETIAERVTVCPAFAVPEDARITGVELSGDRRDSGEYASYTWSVTE